MTAPDLDAVDDLCRLAVAAGRLGCRVHLDEAGPELWSLLELAGVTDVLQRCPALPLDGCDALGAPGTQNARDTRDGGVLP